MATNNVKKVAIAWYRREDYSTILDLMEDGTTFPATYDGWLKRAQHVLLTEETSGSEVALVTIDPGSFSAWCAKAEQKPNALARARQLAIALGGPDAERLAIIASSAPALPAPVPTAKHPTSRRHTANRAASRRHPQDRARSPI